MAELSLSDLQGLDNPSQMAAPSGQPEISLSDMQKMGHSDPAVYVPPPPQQSPLDRLKNDLIKPIAEAPQFIGQSLQWLGDSLKTSPEQKDRVTSIPDAQKNIFNRAEDFGVAANASTDKLGNQITQAGLLLQENNKSFIDKNFPDAPPDFLDRVIGGIPIMGEAMGLAALIGLPNAMKIVASQIGLQSATSTYSSIKEQGKSSDEAGGVAFPVGVANGLAANIGFHMFNTEVGPFALKVVKGVVNGALGAFAQGITAGTLDLADGIRKYNGPQDFADIVSEAAVNAAAMGVLMGGVGHVNAFKNHNAIQKAFEDIGMPADKAKASTNELMTQSAHNVIDWVQSKIDATPEQQARIMFLRPDAVAADHEKFNRFVSGTPLDSDFLPTENKKMTDTQKLQAQVEELEGTKQQISDLKDVLSGKITDEQLQKQVLKEQTDITKEVATKHDALLKEHQQEIEGKQKEMDLRQKNEQRALADSQKQNDKILKKDPENEQALKTRGSLQEKAVNQRDQFTKERDALKQSDLDKKTELEKARNADLETRLENRPTYQAAQNELNRIQSDKAKIEEKISKLKDKIASGPSKLESLKQEVRRLEQGFRKGKVVTKDDIKSAQRQVTDLLKASDLEAKDRAKFLDKIRMVDSSEKLEKLLPEIKNKIGVLEQRAQQEKWGKQLQEVQKKVLPKLLVKDQDILKPILDSFDFKNRSRNTILTRAKALDWFKEKLSAPGAIDANGRPMLVRAEQQVLDMAAKKSFSEMSHDEIEAVHTMIMKAVHEAKVAAGLDVYIKGESYRAVKEKALADLRTSEFADRLKRYEGLDNLARENVDDNRNWKDRLLAKADALITEQKLPEILYDIIGRRDLFEEVMHPNYQNKSEAQRQRMLDLAKIFWDVDISKMYEPIDIKDLKYDDETISYEGREAPTKAKLLDIYANSFDEDSRLHLVSTFGEAKTNALIGWVEENMPKEAKAAQRMFDYYRDVQGPRLDAAVVDNEGHHMNQVYYYNPTGNSLESRGTQSAAEDAKFGSSGMSDRALPVSGFTKSRVGSKLEFEHFDYFDKIMKNLLDSENYIHMYGAVKNVNRLFFDPEYTSAIKDALGQDFLNVLQRSIRDVAYDGHQYDGQAGQLMRYLRTNFVYAKIGWNAFSAGKVISQLSPAATYVDTRVGVGQGGIWVQKAVRDYMFNAGSINKMIDSKSLQMKNRTMATLDRELSDAIATKGVSSLGPAKLKDQYVQASMAMHYWADRFVTRTTWLGAYNKVMAENEIFGGTEKEAINAADRAVRRTHPMGQVMYLPDVFRGSEWKKTLTTFHNATNRNLNLQAEMFRDQAVGNQEWYHTAGQFMGYAVLPAMWLSFMALRRPPSAKEFGEEVASQSVGSDLYFGLLTSAIARGQDAEAPNAMAAAATDLAHMFERKDKLGAFAAISEDFSGIPVSNAGRILSGKMFHPVKEKK